MEESWRESFRKAILLSGGTGLLFGVAFSVFMLVSPSPEGPKGLILLVVPVLTTLVSGAAGAAGAYLDRYLIRRGVAKPASRRLISFATILVGTFSLVILAAVRARLAWQGNMAWGMLAGLGFGSVVAFIDYRLWQVRQRMLTLELENKYLSEIAEKDSQLTEATESLVLAEERARMARDLHDSISSGIHGIAYAAHSLRETIPAEGQSPRVLALLDLVEKTAQSTQDELRAMILELKPSLIDEKGLAEALRLHCELFSQRQAIPVDLKVDYASPLSAEQQVAIYRIVQEALANVQKHSGATRVSVSLTEQDGSVDLRVSDNGAGFTPGASSGGLGLHNMESRCTRNNGTFRVDSTPGKGTTISASFKIPE
ncbi:MAG: sensor histidine kinase [Bacillota bacterium]